MIRIKQRMEEQEVERTMLEIDYHRIKYLEYMLPNGKS